MQGENLHLGAAGLLRVAGLPAKLWMSTGNPELFDNLRRQVSDKADYAAFASLLAVRLGAEVVPHPQLDRKERAEILALRRKLHKAARLNENWCEHLARRVSELNCDLAEDLITVASWSTRLHQQEVTLASAVEAESARLAELSWHLVKSSIAMAQIVDEAAPGLVDEIQQRLTAGETWNGKRLRRRSDYLLRLLARGTMKTTPRGWFCHVALIGIDSSLNKWPTVGSYAVSYATNIHADRQILTNADLAGTTVTITGLHWIDNERLYCWVVDDKSPVILRRVTLKRTVIIDSIRQALHAGASATEDLIRVLLLSNSNEMQRKTLADFIRSLARLGILQLSIPPKRTLSAWASSAPEVEASLRPGYIDVYRKLSGAFPEDKLLRLEESVAQAIRIGGILQQARAKTGHSVLRLVKETPRSVTEILAEFLREDNAKGHSSNGSYTNWPPRITHHNSAYSHLLAWMERTADAGVKQAVITPEILDEIGASPAAPLAWPLDCLIRPLVDTDGIKIVLEAVYPAAMIDARFIDSLEKLHGNLPQVEAYRAFLHNLAECNKPRGLKYLYRHWQKGPPMRCVGRNTLTSGLAMPIVPVISQCVLVVTTYRWMKSWFAVQAIRSLLRTSRETYCGRLTMPLDLRCLHGMW